MKKAVKYILRRIKKKRGDSTKILDNYVLNEPNKQNVLDIFKGEWSSQLPENFGLSTEPGTAGLFEDSRIVWAEEVFGGFRNSKILELGPLEGGHSYMLQNLGAEKIISIEANTRAFLKCLCVKEIFKLNRVEFMLGDFMSFLRKEASNNEYTQLDKTYDIVFASGVLYHMEKPIELLDLISRVSDKIFIWTQYYDERIILGKEDLAVKFSPANSFEHQGASYQYATQSYNEALGWAGFCGGPKQVSKWLTRDSIIKALNQFGFTEIQIGFDDPEHPNGPSFAICAAKL